MRNGKLIFSALQFLLITALFGVGVLCFGLDRFPELRNRLVNAILNPSHIFFVMGAALTGIGALLGLVFWKMQKGGFVRIEMQKNVFSLHESLVREAVSQFWSENFPEENSPTDVYCAQQKIEIITEDQNQDLEAIEEKLSAFLSKQLGYEKKYFICLTKKEKI